MQRDITRQEKELDKIKKKEEKERKACEKEAAKAAKKKPLKARKVLTKSYIIILKARKEDLQLLDVKSSVQALVPTDEGRGVQMRTKSGRLVQLTIRAKESKS